MRKIRIMDGRIANWWMDGRMWNVRMMDGRIV